MSSLFNVALSEAGDLIHGIPAMKRVVLLGESTHGTEEFYRTRLEMTKRLVTERGFTVIVLEADWPFCEGVNEYAHGLRAAPFASGDGAFPSWMWRNAAFIDLLDWARKLPPSVRPLFLGMDCYSLFESKRAVIAFLEKHDAEFAVEVKERLSYMDRFDSGFAYAEAMVKGNLSRISGHITACLTKMQARLQWGSDKYDCTDFERLSAEQNCEVIIAADEYYTKCISEPPGSQASWNARDQHMTTTLLRIKSRLSDPLIVVWAHNSHVGDAAASARGGEGFERNETWNLGQMARATFGDSVWIVGQYTYGGTVTAASGWGEAHADVPLLPALPESWEGQLHELVLMTLPPAAASDAPVLSFCTASPAACAGSPLAALAPRLDALLGGGARLQRWVGVTYKPDTERASHYGSLALRACYDQIVFIDATSALRPVAPRPSPTGSAYLSRASTQRLLKVRRAWELDRERTLSESARGLAARGFGSRSAPSR
jgi:erythromycin esterase-like protein